MKGTYGRISRYGLVAFASSFDQIGPIASNTEGCALLMQALAGWRVLILAACGGAMALSYLMPPINLSYRGLGETVIAIAYGPGLTLGSFYLQTGRLGWMPILASAVPGLGMFAMALAKVAMSGVTP